MKHEVVKRGGKGDKRGDRRGPKPLLRWVLANRKRGLRKKRVLRKNATQVIKWTKSQSLELNLLIRWSREESARYLTRADNVR